MLLAKILDYDGERLILRPETAIDRELLQKQAGKIELRVVDGRQITLQQRRKIFAVIRDISDWSGYEPEQTRMILTWQFRSVDGRPDFSLSDVDRTTARAFLNYLIEFCFHWNVPTMDTLLRRTDDIDAYLYQCLAHRKCAVCNLPADVHHVDRVGMGREKTESVVVTLSEETSEWKPDCNGTVRKVTTKREVPQIVEIPAKLSDANKAAELLGKRYGMFTDRVNVDGGVQVIFEGMDDVAD